MGNGKPKPSITSGAYEGNAGDQTGAVVLQEVVQMTGLSEEFLDSEISTLLGAEGQSVTDMTLDQLRSVLMSFLESMNDQMNAEVNAEQLSPPAAGMTQSTNSMQSKH